MADTAKVQKDLPVNPVPAKQAALPANTTVQTTPLLSNESSTNAASEIFAAPQEIVQSESPVPVQPRKAEGEQLASLGSKPTEFVEPKKPAVRPVPKPLSGYIVQIAFADGGSAQRWAESMERRGFAVSVTDAGEAGGVRVRLGNFAARDQAERQLQMLRQEGLKGIVLNLPQAFRPEARASIP
jgi:DedD protein